jgi:hypothetical protein
MKHPSFIAIHDELTEARRTQSWPGDTPQSVMRIAEAIQQWVETKNPFLVDYAHELILTTGAPVLDNMRRHLFDAMECRRVGTLKGTWKQVRRYYAKNHVFLLICNFRYHGMPVFDASVKAAAYMDEETDGEFTWTASTLEKEYQIKFIRTGSEEMFHNGWIRHKPKEHEGWEAIKETMPNLPQERISRIGTRR